MFLVVSAEHGIKLQFLPCCIMEKLYANAVLLLPKGSFYAEMFCAKFEFPCVSFVQKVSTLAREICANCFN